MKSKKVDRIDKLEERLATMLNNGFQSTRDLFIEKFDKMEKKFDGKITQVVKKIDQINLNLVDVVHQEEFDKLDNRVVDLEEVSGMPLKKS